MGIDKRACWMMGVLLAMTSVCQTLFEEYRSGLFFAPAALMCMALGYLAPHVED
jgi:hypothetical protein